METTRPGKPSDSFVRPRRRHAAAMGLLLTLALAGTAAGQPLRVTGTVTSTSGAPLAGVIVRVAVPAAQDTAAPVLTNEAGRYAISARATDTLRFSFIGHRPARTPVNGRTTIDVVLERLAVLDEVVVTGYSGEQRRSEITGAVASVNLESASRQSSASVLQRLDANVTGVTVDASGSPGSRSTVRIRGVSSFQNNDPLYIVDGTPVQDSYVNWLNPNDIASIQVLKDASAASIYGARASNGVIIIETVKGSASRPTQTRLSVRTGVATPVRGYDDFLILDAMEYYEVVRQSYVNAGQPVPTNVYGDPASPSIPTYIWPNNCGPDEGTGVCTDVDESTYSFPNNLIMPASTGTNWWDAVFGPAPLLEANLSVSGGGQDVTYAVSFNYFDQTGTAAYNRFQRGSIRVNTSFNRGRLTLGENLALSGDRNIGGIANDMFGEDGILGKNILSQPIVPIYDVQGNFASGKAVGLGNNDNPLKNAWAAKDNASLNGRIFGNAFAEYDLTSQVTLRSTLGFNLGQGSFSGFTPIFPENSEPTFSNSVNENTSRFTDFTWSNTARYARQGGDHNVTLLLGQEMNRSSNRFITASMANLVSTDPSTWYVQDALGDATTKNVSSTGGNSALLSFFGRADYNYADRYVLSLTLRRDGSSNLGPDHRWGTFPAVGAGWRVSRERFLEGNPVVSDLMLRVGWGITGNQQIPAGRIVTQFGGGRDQTFYDITGSNTNVVAGFRRVSLGNQDLKWEENRSVNAGMDLGLFDNRVNVILDVYQRTTDNLLFDPPTPGTSGTAAPPIVNVGQMRNRGIDFSISHQNERWGVTFNGSHYRNRITRIDGVRDFFYGPVTTRFGNQVINQVGQPIGAFYGYIADGLFRDAADVAAHVAQDGKAPGRIKFRDVNGDGQITLADRTIIGTPHPDFTAGLDMQYRWRAFDLAATVFGTFGNEIFDVQKEFYVFRNFSTNVRRDLLTNSWTPENPDAKYPRLDVSDQFSNQLSTFYVEDGSYVRLRNMQLGYTLSPTARWLSNSRIYLQVENLFTITGYDGLDPALPAANVTGPVGDIRDQYRGIDRGTYPSNRTFSVGISTSW